MKVCNKLRTFYRSVVTASFFYFFPASSNHLWACDCAEQLRPDLPPLKRTYTQHGRKQTAFCVWQCWNRTPAFDVSLIWCTRADLWWVEMNKSKKCFATKWASMPYNYPGHTYMHTYILYSMYPKLVKCDSRIWNKSHKTQITYTQYRWTYFIFHVKLQAGLTKGIRMLSTNPHTHVEYNSLILHIQTFKKITDLFRH
jgi:hypothetical protein